MVWALGLTACTDDCPEDNDRLATVRVTVSAGAMQGVGVGTRAVTQLGPEMENTIKTLHIFQFDGEGQHRKEELKDYHFKQLQNEQMSPDGVLVADITDIALHPMPKTTIVFVANVGQELVDRFYQECADKTGSTYGNITLEQFKQWYVKLPYRKDYKNDYGPHEVNRDQIDKEGLLTAIYMCGYYEGELNAGQTLNISMGRIPALLDITFNIMDDIEKSIGCHLTNINDVSYIFPHNEEYTVGQNERFHIHHPKQDGQTGPVIERGAVYHCYYYFGGHTTEKKEDATQLKIYYGTAYDRFHVQGGDTEGRHDHPSATLIISNQGQTESNRWGLNRNTIYRITVNVHTGQPEAPARARALPDAAGTPSGSRSFTRTCPDGSQVIDLYLSEEG